MADNNNFGVVFKLHKDSYDPPTPSKSMGVPVNDLFATRWITLLGCV